MQVYTEQQLHEMGLLREALPRHVAIIMDGNGRCAKARRRPRTFGHRAGVERLRDIIEASSQLGIEALSLYAFSTENWKRPTLEVNALFELLIEYFSKEIDELHANGVRIRSLGDFSKFPQNVCQTVREAERITAGNTGLALSIAINYGSLSETVMAASKLAQMATDGEIAPGDISEAMLKNALYTSGLPDVDLLIRTGGDMRLSNFLLLQCAYAELIFTDDFWPDFTKARYLETLITFRQRVRRFGGL